MLRNYLDSDSHNCNISSLTHSDNHMMVNKNGNYGLGRSGCFG